MVYVLIDLIVKDSPMHFIFKDFFELVIFNQNVTTSFQEDKPLKQALISPILKF